MGKKSTKLGVASLIVAGAGIAAVAAKSKKTEEKKRVKEIQKEEHDTFRNTERGKYTKNSKGIYYSNGNYEAFARPEKPEGVDNKSAYLSRKWSCITCSSMLSCKRWTDEGRKYSYS